MQACLKECMLARTYMPHRPKAAAARSPSRKRIGRMAKIERGCSHGSFQPWSGVVKRHSPLGG